MSSNNRKKCIYGLRKYCIVYHNLIENGIDREKVEEMYRDIPNWVKLNCAMCVKSLYAKSRFKAITRYSVVNTL